MVELERGPSQVSDSAMEGWDDYAYEEDEKFEDVTMAKLTKTNTFKIKGADVLQQD